MIFDPKVILKKHSSIKVVLMCNHALTGLLVELEAYAGVISALRAQGDLTKDKKDLLGELTKVLR